MHRYHASLHTGFPGVKCLSRRIERQVEVVKLTKRPADKYSLWSSDSDLDRRMSDKVLDAEDVVLLQQ